LNSPVTINEPLKSFYEFSKGLPSEDMGITLSNPNEIRWIHNSFSRPEPFLFKEDKKKPKKKQDDFHFVSNIPFEGNVYELDGLQKGPIIIGKFEGDDWIPVAAAEIQSVSVVTRRKKFDLLY
jgi:ubiquitin carboxyl-terminal hydrolase L5